MPSSLSRLIFHMDFASSPGKLRGERRGRSLRPGNQSSGLVAKPNPNTGAKAQVAVRLGHPSTLEVQGIF